MNDYSNLIGCWIDGAIPRNNREIALRLTEIAAFLKADSDQLAHEPDDMSTEDTEMWLQDIIDELDRGINEILNESGFLAVWDSGDYIVFHQTEYFENENDYLI